MAARRSDFRRQLESAAEQLDPVWLEEQLQAMIVRVLTVQRERVLANYRILCKSCRKESVYDIPYTDDDLGTQMKAFEILVNQMQGKPTETRRVEHDWGALTREALEKMSTAELAELAGIVDGEWSEVRELEAPAER